MPIIQRRLSKTFKDFFKSEKSGGIILVVCTIASLLIANSALGPNYLQIWDAYLGPLSVGHWVNDGLMAIFFLLIGLELERELYNGELSDIRNAALPIAGAIGGIALPALIHIFLNAGTPTQPGAGIPMATDIAFALGVLAILGSRVPASLKVFLTALAVIDDLGAIIVIAVFYTSQLSIAFLLGALAVFGIMVALNRLMRVQSLVPYLLGGAVMWALMLMSGVHATIAGVLLAFAIPFSAKEDDAASPSHKLEHFLHKPVAFVVMPIFALANTGIVIGDGWEAGLATANSIGIIAGLTVGKPIGIFLVSLAAVTLGLSRLPLDLTWRHIFGAGLLGGIGFTMSIFIANLAFTDQPELINASKMSILMASVIAAAAGSIWLIFFCKLTGVDDDIDTMDFQAD